MTQELKSEPAVLTMTVEIIRAKTGKKEVYELTGTPVQPAEKEADDGRDAPDRLP